MSLNKLWIDKAMLVAVEQLHKPYIWGADGPDSFDCSGFVGYILRKIGLIPSDYDDTAQGYHNRYFDVGVTEARGGCLAFYGKSHERITHIMFCLNDKACIGAIGGGRWTDTVAKALGRKARIDVRPIGYRRDLIYIVDPFYTVRDRDDVCGGCGATPGKEHKKPCPALIDAENHCRTAHGGLPMTGADERRLGFR